MHDRGGQHAAKGTFEDDVFVVRRSALVVAAAAGPLVAGAALACARSTSTTASGALLVWMGLGAMLYAWARNPGARGRAARVRVDARGLFIDGHLAVESARIRAGWLQPRGHWAPLVRVSRRGSAHDVKLAVRGVEQGRALLRALGVDATCVSADYWTMARPMAEPRTFARVVTAAALALALGILARLALPSVLPLAVLVLSVLCIGSATPTRVTVGADGVLLKWLGTLRFVSWSRVVDIEAFDQGVVLMLDGQRSLTLRSPAEHERYNPERDEMVERMHVAWSAYAQARSEDSAAPLVRRFGKRTSEWVRAMRVLPTVRDGYRIASVPAERLWGIVENARADRTTRTGAALALAPILGEDGRERLRSVACSCADPRLRVALATLATPVGASAPEDEVGMVLEAIETEGQGDDEEGVADEEPEGAA